MTYTVSCRGRPIGVTDLGFIRIVDRQRSGWFHPNQEGERMLPLLATPIPAMRAFLSRELRGDDGGPLVHPDMIGSTMFADLSELRQHTESLELTLHRDDGSLVPTEDIGFQDTEALIALAKSAEPQDAELEEPDDALAADVEADAAVIAELLESSESWRSGEESSPMPRYQIHVLVAKGVLLP